ncbi:MAG: hypothetical protein WDZ59_04960 [Pirellulales bacterium]
MNTIELTTRERELLRDVVRDRIGSLREQIHHTTVSHFHDDLKDTEAVLRSVVDKLECDGSRPSAPRP